MKGAQQKEGSRVLGDRLRRASQDTRILGSRGAWGTSVPTGSLWLLRTDLCERRGERNKDSRQEKAGGSRPEVTVPRPRKAGEQQSDSLSRPLVKWPT